MSRALLLATVLTALVAVPTSPASAADPPMWQTPSHNIACAAFESSLRCDMRRLGTRRPRTPASCDFDFGQAFGVDRSSAKGRRLCVSDAVGGPGTPVVRYGRTWRRDGFTCTVKRSGVRCTNPRGHGFELRIGRQRLF
jgi:hypothetical protein